MPATARNFWIIWSSPTQVCSGSISADNAMPMRNDALSMPKHGEGQLGKLTWLNYAKMPSDLNVILAMEAQFKLSPPGLETVLTTDFDVKQEKNMQMFGNRRVAQNTRGFTGDDASNADEDLDPTPDGIIYSWDDPVVGVTPNNNPAARFLEKYWNFTTWLEWRKERVSDNLQWHATAQCRPRDGIVDDVDVGPGHQTLPGKSKY